MTEIAVYHYHPESGLLLGTGVADMSPLEPEVPLVPANATLLEPPTPADGQIAKFASGAWSLVDLAATPGASEGGELGHAAPLDTVVDQLLDATARSMGYRGIDSAVTYADEPAVPKFQREGRSLRVWRSKVWEAFFILQADIAAGTRPAPDATDLVNELPAFELLPESVE